MTRTKTLTSIVAVALSLLALGGTASASTQFVSPAINAHITAEPYGNHSIGVPGHSYSCEGPGFTGRLGSHTASTFTSYEIPIIGPCTWWGSAFTHGCTATLNPGAGTVDIGPSTCVLAELNRYCTLNLLPTSGLHATYTNEAKETASTVNLHVAANNLNYNGSCFGSGSTGEYEGTWILSATNDFGEPVNLRVAESSRASLEITGKESKEKSLQPKFVGEGYPLTLTGEIATDKYAGSHHVFSFPGHEIVCENGTFSGALTSSSSEASASPAYGKCMLDGAFKAILNTNGCKYSFQLANAGPPYTGTTAIACPEEGGAIVFTPKFLGAAVCTISFPAQTLGTVGYTGSGTGWEKHVLAAIEGSAVKYSEAVGGSCGIGGGSGGSFYGSVDLKGSF